LQQPQTERGLERQFLMLAVVNELGYDDGYTAVHRHHGHGGVDVYFWPDQLALWVSNQLKFDV
jgi:hypothetical protein